ncbi:hypothetical protein V2G26_016340 [Clonostachys chloroleuca]
MPGSSSALSSASRREQTFHGAARTMTTNTGLTVKTRIIGEKLAAEQACEEYRIPYVLARICTCTSIHHLGVAMAPSAAVGLHHPDRKGTKQLRGACLR